MSDEGVNHLINEEYNNKAYLTKIKYIHIQYGNDKITNK